MYGVRTPLLVLALALTVSPALAKTINNEPNWEAAPLYTTLELAPNFSDDPRKVEIEAGGDRSIEGMSRDCAGYINWEKPDVDVNYASDKDAGSPAGTDKLTIYVKADKDTSLLVYTPDQKWYCADDESESNLNPSLTFTKPQAGNYNIWVGSIDKVEGQKATVYVTEGNAP